MKKQTLSTEFDELQQHVIGLFNQPPGTPVVTAHDQQLEIESLKRTIGSERFFFVVDLPSFEMKERYGVQKWLDYSDQEFSLKKYWSLVHPGRQKALLAIAVQLYDNLCMGRFALEFMVQRYSSMVALKHHNGQYLLAKKTSSVFQYDEANRLTSYIDEFTLIGDYDGEPLNPTFFNSRGEKELERGGEIMRQTIERFMGMKIFSAQELQIARRMAYEPGVRQQEIADDLEITVNSVNTYSKRFISKARDFFHLEFGTTAEAAQYLKKEGLL